MPLPTSTVSRATKSIADYLDAQLKAAIATLPDNASIVEVKVGNPTQAVPSQNESNHRVNLFFYLMEPCVFNQDVAPDETWRILLHCLITVFGAQEGDVSPGENDLRLVGEIIRIFHEKPILDPIDLDGEQVRLSMYFHPLTLEELNHLWSTQGDTTLRPSLAYQVVLVPIIPLVQAEEAPLVGQVGAQSLSTITPPSQPYAGPFQPPAQQPITISQDADDWTPQICLVYQSACARGLFFQIGSGELAAFTPEVWVAGKIGETVTLEWEIYDASKRWQAAPGDPPTAPASSAGIDPEAASSATTTSLTLPLGEAGQATLTPTRQWARPTGGTVTLRGEPVLITLYE